MNLSPSMLVRDRFFDVLIVIALTVTCSLLFFGIVYSDSKLYIHMTRSFLGVADIKGIEGIVAARPLIPLLAAPLVAFLWMPIAYGVLNSIFWVLSSILMYDVTFRITSSRQQALPPRCCSPPVRRHCSTSAQ
jgi:hypothetical protein